MRSMAKTRPLDINAVAYHEAGHAVFAWRHHTCIRERGITLNADHTGATHVLPHNVLPGLAKVMRAEGPEIWGGWKWRAELTMAELLAGPLAEKRFRGIRHRSGQTSLPG